MRLAKLAGSLFLSLLLAAGLGVVAPAAAQGTQGQQSGVVVTSAQTTFGRALFTTGGRALYDLSFDTVGTATTPAVSSCMAANHCTTAWPPLLAPTATGPFDADNGVHAGLLGTIKRPEGTFQVTYNGHPLYEFIADKNPGDVNGENVAAFNGYWDLLNTRGMSIATQATVGLELTQFGPVLDTMTAGAKNRSLYNLTTDPPAMTACFNGCARAWPPLLTTGRPKAGPGVSRFGLSTITRPDGTHQVTYFGTPLYLFAFDLGAGAAPGLTNGQYLLDPFAFGVWYLLNSAGQATALPVQVTSEMTPTLGTFLDFNSPNGNGNPWTVYSFSIDTPTMSNCSGACARAWEPMLTSAPPTAAAGSGVTQSMLGSIQRADGTFQVTYNGHPLYFFSHDKGGTQNGEGLNAFGGLWTVVSTAGNPVPPS